MKNILFHRRRLSTVQYTLLLLLLGSSVYLLSKKAASDHEFIASNYLSQESDSETRTLQPESDDENEIKPMADPLSVSRSPASVTVTQGTPPGIEYFPEFKLSESIRDSDPNRTLDWLDLWNGDPNCTNHDVILLKPNSNLEPGALVSFPGSGNSWLRMLLMGISGVFINSVYGGEDSLFRSKAKGTYQIPTDCDCTLLQKTHDFTLDASLFYLPEANRTHELEKFKLKGVLIIRNPFKAIFSYRNFKFTGMTGAAPSTAFQGELWDNFVSRSVAAWETLASVWIRGLKRGGIIYYERLRHETRTELKRLTAMLGLSYDEDRFECVVRHMSDNSFKRESSTNVTQIEEPYTASQRLLIHKAIENVQAILKERGLEPLPLQYYDFFDVIPEYGILG